MSNSSTLSQSKGAGYSIDIFSQEGKAPTFTLTRAASRGFDDTKASDAAIIEIANDISRHLNAGLEPAIALAKLARTEPHPTISVKGTIYLTVLPPEKQRP
jgi:hypothetical protein